MNGCQNDWFNNKNWVHDAILTFEILILIKNQTTHTAANCLTSLFQLYVNVDCNQWWITDQRINYKDFSYVTSLNSFDKIGCKCKIFQSLPVYKTAPNLVCDSDSASSQSTLQHSTLCTHNNPHLRVSFYTLFIQIQSIFL